MPRACKLPNPDEVWSLRLSISCFSVCKTSGLTVRNSNRWTREIKTERQVLQRVLNTLSADYVDHSLKHPSLRSELRRGMLNDIDISLPFSKPNRIYNGLYRTAFAASAILYYACSTSGAQATTPANICSSQVQYL